MLEPITIFFKIWTYWEVFRPGRQKIQACVLALSLFGLTFRSGFICQTDLLFLPSRDCAWIKQENVREGFLKSHRAPYICNTSNSVLSNPQDISKHERGQNLLEWEVHSLKSASLYQLDSSLTPDIHMTQRLDNSELFLNAFTFGTSSF